MTKWKWRVLVTIMVVGVGVLVFWYLQYQEKERQQMHAEESELKIYATTADILRMEIDYSDYEQRGNVKDIVLTPTVETEHTMERWKAVSKAFPSIEFPWDEVDKGDWIKVYRKLIGSQKTMQDTVVALSKELPEGEDLGGTESIYIYVRDGVIREGNFETLLKEKEIIE